MLLWATVRVVEILRDTFSSQRILEAFMLTWYLTDGVAPRAKMNQQRSRRFRSAQEAKQKDEDNAEFAKMLKSQNGGVHELADSMAQKKTWDHNAITPGTPFMDLLAASLRYWGAYKVNTDPAWAKVCNLVQLV